MRSDFELLCRKNRDMEIYLSSCSFDGDEYVNNTSDIDLNYYADRLNGAWWMYQELHNSLGFINGGYTGLTEYNIDSVLGRGCFEHFKNAIAIDGTKIGTTEKLQVSYPYAIKMVNEK